MPAWRRPSPIPLSSFPNAASGALLVIEQSIPLGEFASKGVAIDALLSTELMLNIFWPNAPLHDGAVIIHGDRVVAAGVVLPLAQSADRRTRRHASPRGDRASPRFRMRSPS